MATAWLKSLQCRSRALEDVLRPTTKHAMPVSSGGCRDTAQTMMDILDISKRHKLPKRTSPRRDGTDAGRASERHGDWSHLTELPEGHSSRNVLEIIFHNGWGSGPFPGRVERIFKFRNKPSAVAQFEEYRGSVQFRAREDQSPYGSVLSHGGLRARSGDNARCLVHGNEVMGFQCIGLADSKGSVCDVMEMGGGGEGTKGHPVEVRTFSDSGLAHKNAGRGKGRRAMLVCRVIAGRILEKGGLDPFSEGTAAFDSVSWRKGELVVLDSRAVLPCFLIVYRL